MKTAKLFFAALLGCLATVDAALVSVQPGDWSDPNTWGGSLPAANDEVTVAHAVTLNSSTPSLQSLTMTAGSLTVSGWNSAIVAHTVNLQGGTLTHSLQSDTVSTDGWTPDSRVWIQATDVTVGLGATINVFAKGYQGAPSGVATHANGFGPGYGYSGRGGGAYGGNGGGKGGLWGKWWRQRGDRQCLWQPFPCRATRQWRRSVGRRYRRKWRWQRAHRGNRHREP